tara:strand:- start:21 stop:212 length:192 start_codon:yes stop_codon:yes gene_type:complete
MKIRNLRLVSALARPEFNTFFNITILNCEKSPLWFLMMVFHSVIGYRKSWRDCFVKLASYWVV